MKRKSHKRIEVNLEELDQIIERGTHEQLLKARGFYHDLYMSQFRRDIDFSADGEAKELEMQPALGK